MQSLSKYQLSFLQERKANVKIHTELQQLKINWNDTEKTKIKALSQV